MKWMTLYTSLNERDQKALKTLGILLLLMSIFLCLKSLYGFYNTQKSLYLYNQETFALLQTSKPTLKPTNQSKQEVLVNDNLIQKITQLADIAGIEINRLQPQNDNELNIWCEHVNFPSFIIWVNVLTQKGILIKEMNINSTSQPGIVTAQLLIQSH